MVGDDAMQSLGGCQEPPWLHQGRVHGDDLFSMSTSRSRLLSSTINIKSHNHNLINYLSHSPSSFHSNLSTSKFEEMGVCMETKCKNMEKD